jgi:hypothetical protein
MPAALLSAGTALMVPVLLVWWLTHRGSYPRPWSIHPATAHHGWVIPVLFVVAAGVITTGMGRVLQYDLTMTAGATVGLAAIYLRPVLWLPLIPVLVARPLGAPQLVGAAVVVASVALIAVSARQHGAPRSPGRQVRQVTEG